MSEKTENKENIEEQTIGATESRLLQEPNCLKAQ